MKSELSFLMDLFLDDEVPAPIKKLVAKRIRDVETHLGTAPLPPPSFSPPVPRGTITTMAVSNPDAIAQQSPSMQRIMQQHPDVPVVVQPVTPAAANALQQRAAIIHRGISTDKAEPGRTSPRKF